MQAFHKISAATITKIAAGRHPPARLSDGGGLFLTIKPGGTVSWLFRYLVGRKAHYVGLRRMQDGVTATVAREQAAKLRIEVRHGRYPHMGLAKVEPEPEGEPLEVVTVAKAVEDFLKIRPPSKNAAAGRQWEQTLSDYVVEPLGHLALTELTIADVITALSVIWTEAPETARRTLARLRRILDREIALGRITTNVAQIGPVRAALGDHKNKVINHAAMPYDKVAGFLAAIAPERTITVQAVTFLTLTAARTGEVRWLRWRHIDWKAKAWRQPAEATKTGRPHTIPLSNAALAILRDMQSVADPDDKSALVFPGTSHEGSLSENSLLAVMKRHGWKGRATPHGMRAAFRTWCAKAGVRFEVAEEALAHQVGSATERAYERPDYLDERRVVMDKWARYLVNSRQPVAKPGKGRGHGKVIALNM